MRVGPLSYMVAFLGSLVLSWGITPLALRLATRRSVVDRPSLIKDQQAPVPYLGGAAIVIGLIGSVSLADYVLQGRGDTPELMVILTLALVLAIMGLADDLRGLHPFLRLGVEVAAAAALVSVDVQVHAFPWDWVNAVVTVIWVVGIINAVNLIDNMDGLSAGTAAIAAGWFFALAAMNEQYLVGALAAALTGCALGFLRHNFHPAKIYMGDAGSLFLGFMLAVIGMKLRFPGPVQVTFLVPILVCGVFIFDTVLVVFDRLRHGRNPLSGGRDHTSHRLVFIGLPVRWTVGVIYTAGFALGWISMVLARIDRASAYLLAGLAVGLALLIMFTLARVPVYGADRGRFLALRAQTHEDLERSKWAEATALSARPTGSGDAVGAGTTQRGAR